MKIAICDDNKNDIDALSVLMKELDAECFGFNDPDSLCEAIGDGGYDAVVMDVELGAENGISAAAKLVHCNPELPVIFYTAYAEKYSQNIFIESDELSPFALIAKPPSADIVQRCLEKLKNSIIEKESTPMLTFRSASNRVTLSCREIMYIESCGHSLLLHCADGNTHRIYEKLSQVHDRLPDHFAFCHKSFVVNSDYVKLLSAGWCTMADGTELSVSRSRKEEFKRIVLMRRGTRVEE
ncbi:MAG: response regulator transcription factor [Oscillospiraceae bacterium]|nr:response regulator transcription factor [Oscillospiraceae bacterium]